MLTLANDNRVVKKAVSFWSTFIHANYCDTQFSGTPVTFVRVKLSNVERTETSSNAGRRNDIMTFIKE